MNESCSRSSTGATGNWKTFGQAVLWRLRLPSIWTLSALVVGVSIAITTASGQKQDTPSSPTKQQLTGSLPNCSAVLKDTATYFQREGYSAVEPNIRDNFYSAMFIHSTNPLAEKYLLWFVSKVPELNPGGWSREWQEPCRMDDGKMRTVIMFSNTAWDPEKFPVQKS